MNKIIMPLIILLAQMLGLGLMAWQDKSPKDERAESEANIYRQVIANATSVSPGGTRWKLLAPPVITRTITKYLSRRGQEFNTEREARLDDARQEIIDKLRAIADFILDNYVPKQKAHNAILP